MTPRSFFIIVIKIVGIYFILSSLNVIPQFVSNVISFGYYGFNDPLLVSIVAIAIILLMLGLYYLAIHFCILKPEKIINLLRLDKGFDEEKFELNIHYSSILRIAVIVIGGIMLVDAIPELFSCIYESVQQKRIAPGTEVATIGWTIFYFFKALLAILLLGNSKLIVNFIERQKKK